MTENLIDKLKEMGFNTYEAKVYLALLKHHPATGYEISKESGVPQARAYDTLKALESNHVVVALGGKPLQYTPVNPDELLDRWERTYKGNIGFLRETLPTLANETVEPVINLRGNESIYRHACELIDHAEESIFIELWAEDAERIAPRLIAAKERGVDLKVVGYNHCELNGISVFQHGESRTVEHSFGGRWLILSVDEKEGMVGTITGPGTPSLAVVTRSPGIVIIIKELIVHDIFLLDIEQHLGPEMEKVYGEGLSKLRNRILGNGIRIGIR